MNIQEVKSNLRKIVYYELNNKTHEYRLNACILRFDKQKEYYYQAELLDRACNHSVLIVALENVQLSK